VSVRAPTTQGRRQTRTAHLVGLSVLIGTVVPLLAAEAVLRVLPVNGGLVPARVSAGYPVYRLEPDRRLTWSKGWGLSLVNRIRVNKAGYVNDQEYDASDPRPLFAIVGDSFVEAAMVPYGQTLHGRLAAATAPAARVYTFAASAAPLSQYVIWAREAREHWGARALAVVVIGNDFDESLAANKTAPGFHLYVPGPDGALVLRLYEYTPTWRRAVLLQSALGTYLVFNGKILQIPVRWRQAAQGRAIPEGGYVGNTLARADPQRLDASKAVVGAFLRDMVGVAGWNPRHVVFVVDGFRYQGGSGRVSDSYFALMRTYFMDQARRTGFETVDMDEHFFAVRGAERPYFEFPQDRHWNGVAHALAAEALAQTRVFRSWRTLAAGS
jgi:hypothetical protein